MDISGNKTVLSMCGLCGEKCLVDLSVKDGRIVSVQKAENRYGLKGNICVKGAALRQYIYHKDRLQYPMKRVGDHFERVSWDTAISEISEKLLDIKEKYGAKSTIVYVGHPKWARRTISEFASVYGTPNFATESSSCNTAMVMAWKLVSGEWMRPDLKNCDNLLIWSGNPAYSGKEGEYADIMAVKERGAKLIAVDPRVTPMADKAYKHLQLYPGTDGALALGLANVIISEHLEAKEYIEKYTVGFEEYKEYVREFTPERVSVITGIPAEDIIETARIIAQGRTAIYTNSCAVVHCTNGVQNQRAEFLLLALTGNIDVPGGNLIKPGPVCQLDDFHKRHFTRPEPENDISGGRFPVWDECIKTEAQCIDLANRIAEGEPYPVKAFIGFGVNTGLWPRPDRIAEALKKTELTVVTDLFWNEACEAADYVLPACAYPEMDWVYATPQGKVIYLPETVGPGEKKNDVEIIQALAKKMHLNGEFLSLPDWDAYLEHILKPTGLSLSELKEAPGGLTARNFKENKKFSLEKGLNTPSGKIEFVSEITEKYEDRPGYSGLPEYTDWRESAGDMEKYPFILCTGARKAHLFHSRTYRVKWLSSLEPHTVVNICHEDADKLGVTEGDKVTLSTPAGSMSLTVQLDAGVKKGVVHVYHDDPDFNINLLFPNDYLDPISGFPGYRSYICALEKEA